MVHGLDVINRLNNEATEPPPVIQASPLRVPLPREALRMHTFCDPDSTRFALHGLRVDFRAGVIVATNGRIALRCRVPELASTHYPAQLTFHHQQWRDAERYCENWPKQAAYLCRLPNGRYEIQVCGRYDTDYSVAVRFALVELDGRWPDKVVADLFASEPESHIEFRLPAAMIARLARQLSLHEPHAAIRFRVPTDGTQLIAIAGDPSNVFARTMPCGLDDSSNGITIFPPPAQSEVSQ